MTKAATQLTNESTKDKQTTLVLPGGITQMQLDQWKAKHDEVFQIDIEVDEAGADVATCYVHDADRNVLARVMTYYGNEQLMEAGECIINNCWLGGDERCKSHRKIAPAAAMKAITTVKLLKGTVKKH